MKISKFSTDSYKVNKRRSKNYEYLTPDARASDIVSEHNTEKNDSILEKQKYITPVDISMIESNSIDDRKDIINSSFFGNEMKELKYLSSLKTDNPALKILNFSRFAKDVLEEINIARTNPQKYVSKLDNILRENFDDFDPFTMCINGYPKSLKEGRIAVKEAIRFLKKQKPLNSLKTAEGLKKSAEDLVNIMCLHDGDPSMIVSQLLNKKREEVVFRLNKYGIALGDTDEIVDYGNFDAEFAVISLIICDGDSERINRELFFNPNYKFAGVASGIMPSETIATAITLAEHYFQKGEFVPKKIIETYGDALVVKLKGVNSHTHTKKQTIAVNNEKVKEDMNIQNNYSANREIGHYNRDSEPIINIISNPTYEDGFVNNYNINFVNNYNNYPGNEEYREVHNESRIKEVDLVYNKPKMNYNDNSRVNANLDRSDASSNKEREIEYREPIVEERKSKLIEPIITYKSKIKESKYSIPYRLSYKVNSTITPNTRSPNASPSRDKISRDKSFLDKTVTITNSRVESSKTSPKTTKERFNPAVSRSTNRDLISRLTKLKENPMNAFNSPVVQLNLDTETKTDNYNSPYFNTNENIQHNMITPASRFKNNYPLKTNANLDDADNMEDYNYYQERVRDREMQMQMNFEKVDLIPDEYYAINRILNSYELDLDMSKFEQIPEDVESIRMIEKPIFKNNEETYLVKKVIQFKDGTNEVILYEK